MLRWVLPQFFSRVLREQSPQFTFTGGALGVCGQQFLSPPLPLPSNGGKRWGIWDPRLARRSLYSQKDIKMQFMFLSLGDTLKGLTVLRSNSYHFFLNFWLENFFDLGIRFATYSMQLILIAGHLCRTEVCSRVVREHKLPGSSTFISCCLAAASSL